MRTLLARLMETQIWCPSATFVGGGLSKGTMAFANTSALEKAAPLAFALMPDVSSSLSVSDVFQPAAPELELRASDPSKSV